MQHPTPLTRDLVLIGGGHAHALVLRRWGMTPLPGARLTLINPGPVAPYTGMLPGLVAGHYRADELEIDLVRLARFAGARLVLDAATGLDPAAREVHFTDRPPLRFDIASINIGVTSAPGNIPGAAAHGVGAKPMLEFADRWQAYLDHPTADVVVIGGGVAGMELAMAMAHRLGTRGPQVHVVESGATILPQNPRLRGAVLTHATRLGLQVRTAAKVARLTKDAVELQGGERIASGLTVLAGGAQPISWLKGTGLALEGGFICVDAQLRSTSHPHIFAVGDTAHMVSNPRPKAGVYAVRQAPILTHNLRAALQDRPLKRFRPQGDFLKITSLGGQRALAEKRGITLSGAWVWRWKNHIDRRFMEKLLNLPAMPPPAPTPDAAAGVAELLQAAPLCGGCGAKLGRGDLGAVLAGLAPPSRKDVLSGPGDDAAQLAHGAGVQVFTTDHFRAFVEDPYLLARIAANHALGDIWAMGARPQAALAQVTLPRLSPTLARATLAEIMAGAGAVLRAAGADLVGGHTSLGAELVLGFSLTGLCEGPPIGQAGARAGDVLILTKPIGVGVVLAAEMQGRAPGRAVAAAYAQMQVSLGPAAAILGPVAQAMTDVTGFGLAGHLGAMLEASGVGAELRLDDVPKVAGAVALATAGIRSSIYLDNRAQSVDAAPEITANPAFDLLFDPQTAGGLLAAVPKAKVGAVLSALNATGFAVEIGKITKSKGLRVV